jgi:hypothetical protein
MCRVFLEQLIVFQLVKKSSSFTKADGSWGVGPLSASVGGIAVFPRLLILFPLHG